MNEELTGIVVRQQPYREDGLIVTLLTPDQGLVDVLAPHVLKVSNKNQASCQLYAQVQYQCQRKNEQHRHQLLSGHLVHMFPVIYEDIILLSGLELVAQCMLGHRDEAWYDLWHQLLPKCDGQNHALVMAMMLKAIISTGGYDPQVDGCYVCGTTKVHGIAVSGGLACLNCQPQLLTSDVKVIRQWRYLFKSELINFDDLLPFAYDWRLVGYLLEYIDYHQGLPTLAYRFFKQAWQLDLVKNTQNPG